jgi:hypothetical protein
MVFYACIYGVVCKVDAKIFYSDSMHPIDIQMPWFKFQIFGQNEIVFMFLSSTHEIVCLEGSVLYVSMHIDKWFYASNQLSRAMVQILNFKFFQKYIHNWSWIVHKNVRSSMVKTVLQSETSLRNYREKIEEIRMDVSMHACVSSCQPMSGAIRWNVQLTKKFLCDNELILIHLTTNFYAISRSKFFCAAWPGFLCIRLTRSARASAPLTWMGGLAGALL